MISPPPRYALYLHDVSVFFRWLTETTGATPRFEELTEIDVIMLADGIMVASLQTGQHPDPRTLPADGQG